LGAHLRCNSTLRMLGNQFFTQIGAYTTEPVTAFSTGYKQKCSRHGGRNRATDHRRVAKVIVKNPESDLAIRKNKRPINDCLKPSWVCKRYLSYQFAPVRVRSRGITLRKASIHFKQVPLSVVRKILKSQAKQKNIAPLVQKRKERNPS
jgi:hypothetical protein